MVAEAAMVSFENRALEFQPQLRRPTKTMMEQVMAMKELVKQAIPKPLLNKLYQMNEQRVYRHNLTVEPDKYPSLIQKWFKQVSGQQLDFDNPKNFTQKIQWLKIFDSTEIKGFLSDKYLVRDYVAKVVGEEHLVPLLGVWSEPEEIDFEKLPDRFVLKATHGSGWNIIVKDKSSLDQQKTIETLKTWLKTDYSMIYGFELQYRHCIPQIIAEEYIEELSGGLYDYKVHCFGGHPVFIQCIGDRGLKEHSGFQDNFDLEWNKLDWIFEDYPHFPYDVNRPEHFEELLSIAEDLAVGFEYVRVDLYEIGDTIYFGEMTFTPASGAYPYKGSWTEDRDRELGDLIRLKYT